jgi:small-conductance mechanosensitive channel
MSSSYLHPSGSQPGSSRPGHLPAAEVVRRQLRSDFRRALVAGLLAVIVLAVGSNLGGLHAAELRLRLIAVGLAAGFAILGVIATHGVANGLARAAAHTSPGAGSATRLLCVLTGYLVVLGGTLGLLTVPWQQLLVGGAVTGVIAGIAAQQPLSNLFAGVQLLVARPFVVGQSVRVHSGALGGPLEGVVTDISLIYTTLHQDDDVVRIPNAALLNSAIRSIPFAADPPGSGQGAAPAMASASSERPPAPTT